MHVFITITVVARHPAACHLRSRIGSSQGERWINSLHVCANVHVTEHVAVVVALGHACVVIGLCRASFASRLSQRACDWRLSFGLRPRGMSSALREAPDCHSRMFRIGETAWRALGPAAAQKVHSSLVRDRVTDMHNSPSQQISDLSHVGLPEGIFAPKLCGHKTAISSYPPICCTCFLHSKSAYAIASPPIPAACHVCPSNTVSLCTCSQRGR